MSDYPQWPHGPQEPTQPPGTQPPPTQPPGWQPPPGQPPPPFGQQPPPPPGYGYQQYGYGYGYGAGPQYAGFWIRFLGYIIDSFVVGIPFGIVSAALGIEGLSQFTLQIAVSACYFAFLDGGPKGQSIGKMAVSIRVVDVDTIQPGIGPARGFGRYFASLLSGLAVGLGYLWMLWDPKKQCWQDKLANTLVVKA